MPRSIRPERVSHINLVVEDFEAAVVHYQDLFDAELMLDLPQAEWHAGLLSIGGVIIEPFAPPTFLLNARYGPHYLGIEYQANMDEVRASIADHGLRIARDIGVALHTHPADGFGVAFEFYAGSFHDKDWALLGGPIKPAAYWRNEHPLGLTGLNATTLAVHDLEAACAFLQSFLGGERIYEAERPAAKARVVGLQVADAVIEVMAATGEGALSRHLYRYGDGLRSTVFGVRDLDQARRCLAERGVEVVPGDAPDSIAVPAEANLGVIFEFRA